MRSEETNSPSPSTSEHSVTEHSAHQAIDPAAISPSAPAFGWTAYAEQVNGRFAMVGFIALLVLEFFTRQDFFTWIGLA